MSARDDWNAGWEAGMTRGESEVAVGEIYDDATHAGTFNDDSRDGVLPKDRVVAEVSPPPVDPGQDFDMDAWDDGYATGYANATGAAGGASARANPYRR